MLNTLSDKDLMSRLERLRRTERETTVEILRHLNEVERRQLYLRLGFSSMFAYCVGHLRYSESAAGRRVQVARCVATFPEVAVFLERGEVSLVTVSLIAGVLAPSNANELLEKIRGKTQAEVEAIASTLRPAVQLRDRVQPVMVAAASVPAAVTEPELVKSRTHSQCGSEKSPNMAEPEQKLWVQFLANDQFMAQYKEACALLSNRMADLSFAAVFSEGLKLIIERHSPRAREERRERRVAGAATTGPSLRPSSPKSRRSAIPRQTRDAVFVRDGRRCTYVGAGGRRCGATHRLHIDHITPVARGGTNDLSNLRLLCARHNRLEAERVLGEGVAHRRTRSVRPITDSPTTGAHVWSAPGGST
jgi:5-methylcytosine-specific restriction endonuclease McrA